MRRTPVALLATALAVAAAALPAAPADAAQVLEVDRDGHVRVREDPYLGAPDPLPTVAPARRASQAAARAAARKGPTVRAELRRLAGEGLLAPDAAQRYRDAYDTAQHTLERLHAYRHAQLKAVLSNLDAMAAGGLLVPTRLPALFLTLERNRAWWAAAAIPAPGRRVSFAGSRLVWQHYPGQGLQIQWLGTFGKANALFASGEHDPDLRALLDEALRIATVRAGGIAFEYLFRFGGGRPPWVSGLAQGTALSALSRAAVRLGDPRYFEAARTALGIFRTPPPSGVRVDTPVGAHYLQYSFNPKMRVANGFVQALNGLHDFAGLANDAEGRALFAAGEAQLRNELPGYDTGAWSLYSASGRESDLGYHQLLRDFLAGLCQRVTRDQERAAAAPPAPPGDPAGGTGGAPAAAPTAVIPDPALYCATAVRFTADLRTKPVLELAPATLRVKKAGAIRFTLSKVSVVSVTVLRKGRVVLQRRARLGHGAHRVALRPTKPGALEVRVRAVDLAGNSTDAAVELMVHKPPARP